MRSDLSRDLSADCRLCCQQVYFKIHTVWDIWNANVITSYSIHYTKLYEKEGVVLLVLSDRNIREDALPIPAAMAVGAVQKTLVENLVRCDSNIIVETAAVSYNFV